MTFGIDRGFAPRRIVQARRLQARAFRLQLIAAMRSASRLLPALKAHLACAWQQQRELELLLHADDRLLADIGLTRYDVVAAAQESQGWRGRRDALQAAAARRDEAIEAAGTRRKTLPHAEAPALVPALPCAMETANFR